MIPEPSQALKLKLNPKPETAEIIMANAQVFGVQFEDEAQKKHDDPLFAVWTIGHDMCPSLRVRPTVCGLLQDFAAERPAQHAGLQVQKRFAGARVAWDM